MSQLVKICGIRSPELAASTAQAGADLIGFVFAESKRRVEPAMARASIEAARQANPAIRTCALFVDASADEIERIHAQVGFDLAQLHGPAALEVAAQLSMPAIISVRVAPDDDRTERAEFAERVAASGAEFVMVDGYHPGMAGGTGVRADWDFAAMLANRVPLMLAGGLDAENVAEAIAIVRPAVVDVSSGVERAGVKDETLIRSFIDAARAGYAQSISSGTSSQDAP